MFIATDINLVMDTMTGVILKKYRWFGNDAVHVNGYVWLNGIFTGGKEFLNLISACQDDFDHFRYLTNRLNGQFSIIIRKKSEIWITCCHTWTFPLFYRYFAGRLRVSDTPEILLRPDGSDAIDTDTVPYFLQFGVTPDNLTLIKDIYQVRPGEILRFRLNPFHKEVFQGELPVSSDSEKSEEETYCLIRKVFDKFALYLQGKKVLVPLTGGYDSRLIACMLKETGHSPVICATWGRVGNEEGKIAARIAGTLGFPHLFVPTGDKITPDFMHESGFNGYIRTSGHFSSMPYLQDFFAVRYLHEKGIIDDGTVVLPGHPGDFLRGAHFSPSLHLLPANKMTDTIISRFGTSLPMSKRERAIVREQVTGILEAGKAGSDLLSGFDRWDLEERQCKFIANSDKVYHYFNTECLLPLFDRELLNYFLSLPFHQRLGSVLYNSTLVEKVFKIHNCAFSLKTTMDAAKNHNPWKEGFLGILPHKLKEWYYPLNDVACYREITRKLTGSDPDVSFRKPGRPHFYNGYLVQWYINQVEAYMNNPDYNAEIPTFDENQ